MTFPIAVVALLAFYLVVGWSLRRIKTARKAAERAQAAAAIDRALYEKYNNPRLSQARLAELNAERWFGD